MNIIENVPHPKNISLCKGTIIYLSKKFHRVEVWNKTEAKKHGGEYLVVCGIIYCNDGIIISSHGSKDGELTYYKKIMEIISDPNLSGREIKIHCCNADKVSEKYPELREFILKPNIDGVRQIYCNYYTKDLFLYHRELTGIELLENNSIIDWSLI